MPLTRANAEAELVSRGRKWLELAELATTSSGSNADLAGPIAYGLRGLGVTLSNPTNPADADLAGLASSSYDQLYDAAEVRMLENALSNLGATLVDQTMGVETLRLSQARASLETLLERKLALLQSRYGIGLSTLTGGTINLDFAERLDEFA